MPSVCIVLCDLLFHIFNTFDREQRGKVVLLLIFPRASTEKKAPNNYQKDQPLNFNNKFLLGSTIGPIFR